MSQSGQGYADSLLVGLGSLVVLVDEWPVAWFGAATRKVRQRTAPRSVWL